MAIDPTRVELPTMTDGVVELLAVARHPFAGPVPPGYELAIVLAGTQTRIGTLLLRVDEGPGVIGFAGQLAYEIVEDQRGHGYAARACRLVAPLARLHLAVVWIMTAPDNFASRRTAEAIGAEYVDTRPVPPDSDIRALGIDQVRRYRWLP
jgi:tagatose 1,6-diphosphate aldolase